MAIGTHRCPYFRESEVFTVVHCSSRSLLQVTAVNYSELQWTAVNYSELQTVNYSELQWTIQWLQWTTVNYSEHSELQ